MKQIDQIPDIRKQFDQFMNELQILTEYSVIAMIGTTEYNFYSWRKGYSNSIVDGKVKRFLSEAGSKFLELTKALKTARKDRIALHQERAALLQKARIHSPSKTCAPSLNNSTI